MSNCILVPIKRLSAAKTRLEAILSPTERSDFATAMFHDVLIAAKGATNVEKVLVVTPDEAAADVARNEEAEILFESQTDGLNQAVRLAVAHALKTGFERLLIVHADVPLLRSGDLTEFFNSSSKIVIAPSRNLDGTNALLLCPPNVIQPRYGRMSFDAHVNLAREKRLEPLVITNKRIALDIDTPLDLVILTSQSPEGYTGEFLREHDLSGRLQTTVQD